MLERIQLSFAMTITISVPVADMPLVANYDRQCFLTAVRQKDK